MDDKVLGHLIAIKNEKMNLAIELPDMCKCGFSNLNIHGTRMNGRLKVEVRCMRCGKPLSRVEKEGA